MIFNAGRRLKLEAGACATKHRPTTHLEPSHKIFCAAKVPNCSKTWHQCLKALNKTEKQSKRWISSDSWYFVDQCTMKFQTNNMLLSPDRLRGGVSCSKMQEFSPHGICVCDAASKKFIPVDSDATAIIEAPHRSALNRSKSKQTRTKCIELISTDWWSRHLAAIERQLQNWWEVSQVLCFLVAENLGQSSSSSPQLQSLAWCTLLYDHDVPLCFNIEPQPANLLQQG